MPIIDIVLLIILTGFIFYGLFFGFIRALGSLVALVVGLWLTFTYYLVVFDWAKNLFFGHNITGKVLTFIILFTIINRLIGFIFAIIDRSFNLISIIPFLKTINRLAGGILGLIEGGLVLGIILVVATNLATPDSWLAAVLAKSQYSSYLILFAKIITPLIPELLNKVKTVM